MPKLDLKKEFKSLYTAKKTPAFVDPVPLNRIHLSGKGDPNTSEAFQNAVEALYGTAYTLKFMVKKSDPEMDFTVMPLEGLWWAEDMSAFSTADKKQWLWTLFIVQPDHVGEGLFRRAADKVKQKKDNPLVDSLKFDLFTEPHSAQILHVGPYADEAPTIEKLHAFIAEAGHTRLGKHHEIYLSDPRKCRPENMKTILRQPVKRECFIK